jgi:hypothetical protein
MGKRVTIRLMDAELQSRIPTAYKDRNPIPPTLQSSLFTVPLDTLLSRTVSVRQQ